jgi:hypothetical protein
MKEWNNNCYTVFTCPSMYSKQVVPSKVLNQSALSRIKSVIAK